MSIKVGRVYYENNKQVFPKIDGYESIVCLTKSSKYGSLGPYELKDENGQIIENIWQFSKIYKNVPKVEIPYTRRYPIIVWKWPAEIHIENEEPNDNYWNWREMGMKNNMPVRYPVGMSHRKNCVYSIMGTKDSYVKLDYIEARKHIYMPTYINLVRKQKQYNDLLNKLRDDRKLLILETDGPHQESLSYYKQKYNVDDNFIVNHCVDATYDNINIMLNDSKHSFGHGYCLAKALLDDL